NESREDVEKRDLAGAGTTRNDDVGLGQHGRRHEAEAGLVAAAEPDQVVDLEGIARELADSEQRAVERQWADNSIDAGAVGHAGVAERLAIVDAAADGANDELDDI